MHSRFFESDRVRVGGAMAIVIATPGWRTVVVADGGLDCRVVPVRDVDIIATAAGDICVSEFAVKSSEVAPGDLFVGSNGFVTPRVSRTGSLVPETGDEAADG
jgi:hypothetical protein